MPDDNFSIKTVSIIVPCYNEEATIHYLKKKLWFALKELRKEYDVELVFVDDGSRDRTFELLDKAFGSDRGSGVKVKIIRHKQNMNLGAALRTGIQHSTGDAICAIDADCSYDPIILKNMLKKLGPDADMVSAAALHPEGRLSAGIPGYRLFLSKSIVAIYNFLTGKKQYSYACLVRAYKSDVIKSIHFNSDDFLAMSEIMIKALLKGYKVYEYPATNNFRKYGVSKIRLLGVIRAHIHFIIKLISYNLFGTKL